MIDKDKIKELEKRVKHLEKNLEQALNYLGLENVDESNVFHRTIVVEFINRARFFLPKK